MSTEEVNQDEGWEDDDEDDLFSFGVDAGAVAHQVTAGGDQPVKTGSSSAVILENPTRERAGSDDSFLDMLDDNKPEGDLMLGVEVTSAVKIDDKETQEILDWLDVEQSPATSVSNSVSTAAIVAPLATNHSQAESPVMVEMPGIDESLAKSSGTASELSLLSEPTIDAALVVTIVPEPKPTIVKIPPPQAPVKPVFETLQEALESSQSTIYDIRDLFISDNMKVSTECRPHLWARIICGKTLDDLTKSSVTDSFQQWKVSENKIDTVIWIKEESSILGERIVACTNGDLEQARLNLEEVLLFYYQKEANLVEIDHLLPPVACAILSAGVSPEVTSVILNNIMPTFMPILALSPAERLESAKSLHSHFYLLACYHLPLLVFHLDRYAPGWYWPKRLNDEEADCSQEESATQKGRNLENQGVVPQSWLISHLAGECKGTLMNPMWLLSLWDLILTSSNNSLRFFLSLALLEKHADALLMLTDSELLKELHRIMEFKEDTTPEGFDIAGDEDTSADEAGDWVAEWCERARSLWKDTPRSVVSRLRRAEDNAVAGALTARQRFVEERAQAMLDEEAQLHRETQEKERATKADESRERTNRARLLSYYRKCNPEKESNIDIIMKTYEDRLDVLDAKLTVKYGHGFNPVLRPAPTRPMSKSTSKLLSTMNQGFNRRKQSIEDTKKKDRAVLDNLEMKNAVTVTVSSTEVLPILCWTRESSPANSGFPRHTNEQSALKFYLVDSRAEVTVQEEGRFPTALSMSPEALMDPDRIRHLDDMFESLRGAVHIVVMGEGFSAVPTLYGIHPNPNLQHLMSEDDSRTSLCALFFVKKGFPFVSILDGGFAAAHAWLLREGPSHHLYADSVLVDYDGELSLFGRLERQHQDQHAAQQVRTQRAIQNMFESSMASITLYQRRFENASKESETSSEGPQNVQESVKKFFSRPDTDAFHSYSESVESRFKNPIGTSTSEETIATFGGNMETRAIKNPFAGMGNKLAEMRKFGESAKPTEGSLSVNIVQSDDKGAECEILTETGIRNSASYEQSRVMNAFVGLGKQVSKLRSEVPKPLQEIAKDAEAKPSAKVEIPRFRIPFGGGKRGVSPKSESMEEIVDLGLYHDGSESTGTTADTSTKSNAPPEITPIVSVFTGSFSHISPAANSLPTDNQKVHPELEGLPTKNRFAGLGASINKRVEQVNESLKLVNLGVDNATIAPPKLPDVLKRNPFARFSKPTSSNIVDAQMLGEQKSSRLTSLNINITQMRSSAMQHVINLRKQDEGTAKVPLANNEEEHISFMGEASSSFDAVSLSDFTLTSTEVVAVDETVLPVKAEIVKI